MTKLVVIDPGHGGSDPGATGHGLREADLTLTIAKRLKSALVRDFDVAVKFTRHDDTFVALDARAVFANERNAAYFVSVHINSGGGSGYEDFIHNNAGPTTAARRDELHKPVSAFLRHNGVLDRGKKRANFAVLRQTQMAAVLAENLFIDAAADAKLLEDESFLTGLAEAYARGIAAALNLPRVAAPVA
jgi:N-acetylmuramoyl-L-alanine amidase